MARMCSCRMAEFFVDGRTQLVGTTHKATTHDRPLTADDYSIPRGRIRRLPIKPGHGHADFIEYFGTIRRDQPRRTRTGLLSPLHGSRPKAAHGTAFWQRRLRRATVPEMIAANQTVGHDDVYAGRGDPRTWTKEIP